MHWQILSSYPDPENIPTDDLDDESVSKMGNAVWYFQMLSAIVGSIATSVSTLGQVEPETIPFVIEMVQISGLESCAVTVTTESGCKISAARRKV